MPSFRNLLALFLAVSQPAAAAPFQSARTINGTPFEPSGEVTIINYWATWCAPCRIEMPVLDTYYRKHHSEGLQLLAVSLDEGISARSLSQETKGFAFSVARLGDVKMARRDVPAALPVTRVYDATGRLVFASKGDGRSTVDMETLERIVTPLLARH